MDCFYTGEVSVAPRKHHYLPEFYSKWWIGNDNRLVRYTKPIAAKLDVKRVYPSEVGWQKDLYSFIDADGVLTQILEADYFKRLDDKAARILRILNGPFDRPLSPSESQDWTTFIQSLLLRSPSGINAMKTKAIFEYQNALPKVRRAYSQLRKDNDPLTFEEYEQVRGQFDIPNMAMRLVPQLINNLTTVKFIHDMYWSYRTVPEGKFRLLLSDDPVLRTNGLKKPDGHLALPLSPNRLFIATSQRSTMEKLDRVKTSDLIKMVNHSTVCAARHFVIADDMSQTQFIKTRFGSMLRPSIAE